MRIEFDAWRERRRREVKDEISRQYAAIEAVRDLHRPCIAVPLRDGGCRPAEHNGADPPCCLHCAHDWKQPPTLDDIAAMLDDIAAIYEEVVERYQNLYEAARERYEAAEAVIQAVRDVCADESFWAERDRGAKVGFVSAVAVEAIYAALESRLTERRAHWGVELVETVGRLIIPRYRSVGYLSDHQRERIYAVIAAVEDWQEARWGPECWVTTVEDAKALFLHRAQTAEAQVQAVREYARKLSFGESESVMRDSVADSIFRILDGDNDE